MTGTRMGPFSRAHVLYVGLVGLACLALVIVAIQYHPEEYFDTVRRNPWAFFTLLILAFVSRLLSFRMAGMVTFTLDTGVYVTGLLTLGTGAGTLMVFVAMLLRGLVELVYREVGGHEAWPPVVSAAKLIFGPAVTAAIVTGIGLTYDPATRFGQALDQSVGTTVLIYVATSLMLVGPQFAVVTASYRLNRLPWKTILKEVVWPGIVAEAAFLPVGFALAIAYKGRDFPALASLSLSYVIFNDIFRRMWLKSQAARERAEELAVVEEAGRAAASTLDVEDVARRIGMCLLAAVPDSLGVVLTVNGDVRGGARTFIRAVDRADKPAIMEAVLRSLGRTPASWADIDGPLTSPCRPGTGLAVGRILARPMVSPDGTSEGHLSLVMKEGAHPRGRERRLVKSIAMQAAIAVENWHLYSMATVDGLTGLYVRRYLEARLDEEYSRTKRSGVPYCLLMLDVDNLKDVNDEHGHGAGDSLLRAVADALRESVRGMDVACRWGGDEFAALLPDMDEEAAMEVANRLVQAVKRRTFLVGESVIRPSASVGLAACPEGSPRESKVLLAAADRALYRVKRSGSKGTVARVNWETEP
ncbi:MAG: GGDEF domain-containing protein [Deltaproteobacteria bacterium]|nr:GGDEF domain-containing protein [Deltaproteobacteria bacterium]